LRDSTSGRVLPIWPCSMHGSTDQWPSALASSTQAEQSGILGSFGIVSWQWNRRSKEWRPSVAASYVDWIWSNDKLVPKQRSAFVSFANLLVSFFLNFWQSNIVLVLWPRMAVSQIQLYFICIYAVFFTINMLIMKRMQITPNRILATPMHGSSLMSRYYRVPRNFFTISTILRKIGRTAQD